MNDWQHLIGTPYRLGGRDPATGLDCWGLVRLVRPDAPDYAPAAYAVERAAEWAPVASPEVGDVALLEHGQKVHAGVLVAPGRLLHASRSVGVAVHPLPALKRLYRAIRWYRAPL